MKTTPWAASRWRCRARRADPLRRCKALTIPGIDRGRWLDSFVGDQASAFRRSRWVGKFASRAPLALEAGDIARRWPKASDSASGQKTKNRCLFESQQIEET